MPLIQIKNASFYYEVHGTGKPLFLIAGYNGDHSVWAGLLEDLSNTFQVILFDNRASGQTKDDGKNFTLEILADDVIQLASALEIDSFYVAGHSMGGAIALTAAKKYSDKIKKAIIFNTSLKFNQISIMALESNLRLRKINVPENIVIENILPWVFTKNFLNDKNNVKLLVVERTKYPYIPSVRDTERQLEAIKSYDARSWVNVIDTSTLIIAADNDLLTPPTESKDIVCRMKNAKLKIIPGAHGSIVEQPYHLARLVIDFFRGS